jgi:hypothetical protein
MNWLFLEVVATALSAVRSSARKLAKICGDVWLEIEIRNRRATKYGSVNNRTPHDRLMNQIQRAEDRRINNDQDEHRNHEMTRPRFCPANP